MTEKNIYSTPPISVFIRTKNEALIIERTIKAAIKAAEEVIVIDSGSDDGTQILARAAGARVIETKWRGNGAQKRFAEKACQHDWVLDIDADEIITADLATEIANLFSQGEPAHTIYRTPMAFAPPFGKPWLSFGHQKRHKLYNTVYHRAPDHPVWDQYKPTAEDRIGRLSHPILHYAWRDSHHLIAKLNANSSTRAENLPPKPANILLVRIFFALPFYFLKRYLLDGLFQGGVQGFTFSLMAAYGRWLRDVKMYEKLKMSKGGPTS